MTERDLVEMYEERAAIIEHDGGLPRHLAEQKAYWQWRQMVGQGVKAPEAIVNIVTAARIEGQQSGKAG